jgi:hypothetical protein
MQVSKLQLSLDELLVVKKISILNWFRLKLDAKTNLLKKVISLTFK